MTESLVFFYNNFLIKINKMLPLFNFCIKVFARIDTLNNTFLFYFLVTSILVSAHQTRVNLSNSDHLEPFISLFDLMSLRDNLSKTLSDFPLYTIHVREVLTKTGHTLPTDGEWSDSE